MGKKSRITPYFLIIFSSILITFFGCNDDFFNEKAGDRIFPDQHYQSLVDAKVSLQGAIVPLQDAMPRLIMLDGLRSDMMDVTSNADAYLREINNQVFSDSNPFTDPADLYKIIININEILANIDSIANKDRDYDELTAHAYKGALIGLRSWTYLNLVRLFNKVVYIEDNLTSLPAKLDQTILSKEVIIDLLITQLTPFIHDNSTGIQYEELRIPHYMNNKALLGELYLEIDNYANAAFYLKLACESYMNGQAMLKVDDSYKDAAWSTIFLNAESNDLENISVIPFSRAEDQYNPFSDWVGHNCQYLVKPSSILINSFMTQMSAAGVLGDIWRGNGITFCIDTLTCRTDSTFITEPYITKYAIDYNDPFSSDIIISRAADIHLLLAEAYNRMGDPTSQEYAMMLLNLGVNEKNPKPPEFSQWSNNLGIRGRAYLESKQIPYNLSSDSITLVIEDFIIEERALELAYEGKRWFDLVRIAQRRNEPEYLADKVAAKFAGTYKYHNIHAKLMNPVNWYLPFE